MMPESNAASSDPLAGALAYIEAGYFVGPVTIDLGADGKKEVTFHTRWEKDPHGITDDPDQARRWAQQWPTCSWHAPCSPNEIVVVEGDVKGSESGVWRWRKAGGPSSPMKVDTRSGGEHWYFRAPSLDDEDGPIYNSSNAIAGIPAVDVRGEGGTVFIAGSVVRGGGGHYSAEVILPRDRLPELPEHWARRLREATGGKRVRPNIGLGVEQVHEIGWLARRAEQELTGIANGDEANFHQRLFTAAVFGFRAVDAGLLTVEEVRERLRQAIRITWGHEPDKNDRKWLNEAWEAAQQAPWTIVEDGQRPVPSDLGNQWEPVAQTAASDAVTSAGTSSTGSEEPENQSEPVRTTWWPKDISPYLGEESEIEEEPGPVGLLRDDGQALIYAGKINGLIGESESGKSWVAMHAAQQAVDRGEQVLYIDFEDSARGVVSRLRALGASSEGLGEFLVYIGPQESLQSVETRKDFAEIKDARDWSLIIVDGFNVAMTLLGLDLLSNDDATKFYTRLLRPLAATGAAVLYVDHVPKNVEGRGKGGIGAQQKRALTDGAALRVEVNEPFGRGQTGKLRITVDKDRPGHVRGAALEAAWVGTAVLVSDIDTGGVAASIEAPTVTAGAGRREPTDRMVKVSEVLMGAKGEAWTSNAVAAEVGGKKQVTLDALDALVRRGYVVRTKGARGAMLNQFVKRFTTLEPESFLGVDGSDDD